MKKNNDKNFLAAVFVFLCIITTLIRKQNLIENPQSNLKKLACDSKLDVLKLATLR